MGRQVKNQSQGLSQGPKAPMKKQQGQREPKKAQKANRGDNAIAAKATSGDIQLSGRRPRRTVSTPKRYGR